MDNDGKLDIVVSSDGDENVYFLRQTGPGQFTRTVLESCLGQASGAVIQDLEGDGDRETIVTGYEDNVVYIYSR
jgi:hypothetical protein